MTEIIDGEAIAASVREGVTGSVDDLEAAGETATLATVLMSDDPASEKYVSMKQGDCEEVGIDTRDVEIDPEAPAEDLYEAVEDLNTDPAVDGILVQQPLPDHVEKRRVIRHMDPRKDVDGFHPENIGRLVTGDPRFVPCTPLGIQRMLDAAGVDPEGKDAVIVGRSEIVGKPMANLLVQKAEGGNATVTVCHSRTADLGEKTRAADILIAAVGVPELIDGSMVGEGATVIDVGVNRTDEKGLVGDVEFESVREVAGAISPVPGGVGPMTRAMLLHNTVKAAATRREVDVTLP